MDIFYDVPLARLNTFRMKVQAACLVEYDTAEELGGIPEDLPKPWKALGGGSNLLFTGDFPGTLLHSRIRFIQPVEMQEYVLVRVGSGACWDDLCAWAADHGLWGIENLSHIPGEVGAAAVQNIGAYGVEAADVVDTVECYDLVERRFCRFSAAECGYGYRTSRFKEEWKDRYIVTAVGIRLAKEYSPKLDYGNVRTAAIRRFGAYEVETGSLTPSRVRETVIGIRREKLPEPEELGSAGSFFRNPIVPREQYWQVLRKAGEEGLGEVPHYDAGELVKIPAAWLIEKCGWKGRREGNAGVYDRQALVLVNATGQAAPGEILSLEEKIKASVLDRFGIRLTPEVEHI
ncbi:MAG: UDP-N-acetylmuramate dehydrogenase [Bacteroidales bacterium]|nr:UDP-N-acetylmuramate dehydrogenase [Bacteroidales bacterium]